MRGGTKNGWLGGVIVWGLIALAVYEVGKVVSVQVLQVLQKAGLW